MDYKQSLAADKFMREGLQQWLGWTTTLEMAREVAYEHGDIVRPKDASYFEDSALGRLLDAAYSAGALNMGIFLGAIKPRRAL